LESENTAKIYPRSNAAARKALELDATLAHPHLFRLCKPGEDKILTGTPVSAYRYCLMPGLLASKWLRTKVSVGHGPAGTTRDENESWRLPAPEYSCCRQPCAQHYVKSETTIQGCMGHTEMRNTAHWWVVSSGSTYGMPILPKPNQRVFQAVQ
jgi:hypothetical protein